MNYFLKKIISNPFFQGLIAVVGLCLTIYFSLKKEKGQFPLYSVEQSRVIASTPTNKLKILWNKDTIDNVKTVRIALWNGGDKYIDKKDISTTNPISINADKDCQILEVKAIQKSRESLSTYNNVDNNMHSISIIINGDDALDAQDGLVYQILFSSSRSIKWNLNGRVKNVPGGFKSVEWKEASEKGIASDYWFASLNIFTFLANIFNIRSGVKSYAKRENTRGRLITIFFMLLFLSISLYSVYNFYSHTTDIYNKISFPSWVKV